jgi:hypothetical protein
MRLSDAPAVSHPISYTQEESDMTARATTTIHTMARLDIKTSMAFDDFVSAFEQSAPIFDAEAVHESAARGGGGDSWDEVRTGVASNAPNGFTMLASIDATPQMSVAGHHTEAAVVAAGHERTAVPDTPDALTVPKDYLTDFGRLIDEDESKQDIYDEVTTLHPGCIGHQPCLMCNFPALQSSDK